MQFSTERSSTPNRLFTRGYPPVGSTKKIEPGTGGVARGMEERMQDELGYTLTMVGVTPDEGTRLPLAAVFQVVGGEHDGLFVVMGNAGMEYDREQAVAMSATAAVFYRDIRGNRRERGEGERQDEG